MSKSMWKDLFEIYKSVQSGEASDSLKQKPVDSSVAKATQPRTMYIFAYLDEGDGKTVRSMPVQDRLTILELKQQEISQRLQEVEDQIDELSDD